MKRKRKKPPRMSRRIRAATRPARHAVMGVGLTLLLKWVGLMSHRTALGVGRVAGRLVGLFAGKSKAVIRKNLDLAFGDSISPQRKREIESGVFESIGMLAFEAAHSVRWTPADYESRISLEGESNWREGMKAGKGIIMLTGHLGNWELMHPSFLCHTGIAAAIISRDVSNPELNERMTALRGRMGNPIFSSDQSAISYMRVLRKGGALAMLADQDSTEVRCDFIDFFGRPAATPVGPGFLARKSGAALVPVYIHREKNRPTHHVMRFYPPIFADPSLEEDEDVRRMIRAGAECLEQEIRESPEQWAWLHDRWRHQPAEGAARKAG